MDIKKLLGKRIQDLRNLKKIKQEQLAEIIGMETASLSNIERGKYFPSAENLNKIMVALNISPSELFQIEQNQEISELQLEINRLMNENPERVQDIYKIVKALTQ